MEDIQRQVPHSEAFQEAGEQQASSLERIERKLDDLARLVGEMLRPPAPDIDVDWYPLAPHDGAAFKLIERRPLKRLVAYLRTTPGGEAIELPHELNGGRVWIRTALGDNHPDSMPDHIYAYNTSHVEVQVKVQGWYG